MRIITGGFARKGDRDLARFLDISRGLLLRFSRFFMWLWTIDTLSKEGFEKVYRMADEIISMINGLSADLR
jgi:hypothetical protein